MKNREICISEIANTILANDTFVGDSIVFLPVRSKKSKKDYSNLINKIANKISEDGHSILVVTERRVGGSEESTVDYCEIHKFLESQYESEKYDLKMVVSPRFNQSALSQTLVRKGKKIILVIEEFFSTERDLRDDLMEIENLGAEVLGAIYVER
ncbi:hypothetical protein [Enterococcus gilvus]|uniref:hypothetical protein n=1 Tax=Enterococcus gilvus TaxID=160453 RepID=UPI001C8C71A4|nr:hypothetical protein [Enterococcus gilvus]MBX8937887.1 hypothetical protein [Enterococcus gilvus]